MIVLMITPSPTIVLATSNPHKVEELRILLRSLPIRAIGLHELTPKSPLVEPQETGATFEANATIKALSYANQTGLACLADDSGLEVDALDGRPGVISSHYCTDGRDVGMTREHRDHANNERLMRDMSGVPYTARTARFVCVMAVGLPADGGAGGDNSNPVIVVRGTFTGRIRRTGEVPRGTNGFGYDPLFLVGPDFVRTGAELTLAEKSLVSHRAQAAALMIARLGVLLDSLPERLPIPNRPRS